MVIKTLSFILNKIIQCKCFSNHFPLQMGFIFLIFLDLFFLVNPLGRCSHVWHEMQNDTQLDKISSNPKTLRFVMAWHRKSRGTNFVIKKRRNNNKKKWNKSGGW